jgi:predicted RNase H-like HicB family nuclease
MKIKKGKIKVIIEKTDTGLSAYAEKYPVFTSGQTISELLNNIIEALDLYYEDQKLAVSSKNIDFEIDLKQFFQYYRVINSKFLASRIGMNPTLLSHYVQGRKRPSSKQTERILEGIHQIGKELSEINFVVKN